MIFQKIMLSMILIKIMAQEILKKLNQTSQYKKFKIQNIKNYKNLFKNKEI